MPRKKFDRSLAQRELIVFVFIYPVAFFMHRNGWYPSEKEIVLLVILYGLPLYMLYLVIRLFRPDQAICRFLKRRSGNL